MENTTRVLGAREGLALGSVGPVCIAVWRGAVTDATFERQRSALAEVVRSAPGRASFVCVVEPSAKPPDDRLRRASAQMVSSHGTNLPRVAVVIEGSGMKAALTRSVLSGIALLWADRKAKTQFCATARAAAEWIASEQSDSDVVSIAEAVERVRAALDHAADTAHAAQGA